MIVQETLFNAYEFEKVNDKLSKRFIKKLKKESERKKEE